MRPPTEAPAAARCPQCGAIAEPPIPACPACGVDLSPEGARGWAGGPFRQPLFELGSRGLRDLPAWRRAVRATSLAGETAAAFGLTPGAAFGSFQARGGWARPLIYGTLLGGPCLLLNGVEKALLLDDPTGETGFRMTAPLAIALLLVVPAAYLYVRAQALHLTLVMSGRARESFVATLRLVSYSNASVAPLLLVPFAGDFLFLVAGAIVETIGIRSVHRLAPREAAVVELIPASILALGLIAALLLAALSWSQTRG